MANKVLAMSMILAVALISAPVSLFAQAKTGTISGTATGQKGEVLANSTAQLRDVKTKQLVGTTTTNAQGRFEFTGLNEGQYVVEIVGATGAIIGTTAVIALTTGAMVATGVAVTAAATAGAIAGGAAAAGGLGAFFGTTAGVITGVAIAGGVTAGIVAAKNDASPSR